MSFVNLTPVEIFNHNNPRADYLPFVLESAIVNVNRVMSLRVMAPDYKAHFDGKADGYYATASVRPKTFSRNLQLGMPPNRKGENFSNRLVIHWWLTESDFRRIMEDGGAA